MSEARSVGSRVRVLAGDRALPAAGLVGVLCLLLLLAPGGIAAEVSVAQPDVSHLEPEIRERIGEGRAMVERAQGDEKAAAWGHLGKLYYLYDMTAAAGEAFAEATALDPDEFTWPYYSAVVARLEGRLEDVVRFLEAAMRHEPGYVPAWVRLGDALLELGRADEAEVWYSRAVQALPELAAAHFGLGRVALERDRPAAAVAPLERALELQPEATAVHHSLGLAHRALGDLDAAREHLAANRGGRMRLPDPVVDEIGRLLESSQADFQAGVAAMRRGDHRAAIDHFEAALEERPDDHLIPYNLALAHLRLADTAAAVRWLERSVEIDPAFRNGHFNLGMLLADEGRIAEAAERFERAHRADPADAGSHLEWAKALAVLGEERRALDELEALARAAPGRADVHLNLGLVQARLGRAEAAEESFRRAADGGSADAAGELATLLLAQGRAAEAEAALGRAWELDPERLADRERLAALVARGGRFAEAARIFEEVVARAPERHASRLGAAMAYLLAGETAAARALLEDGLALDPGQAEVAHLLARLLAAADDDGLRDGARAVDLAERAFAADPTVDRAETLAMAFAEAGRFEEAVELQRQVVAQAEGAENDAARAARHRLQLYEVGRPCRDPWRVGGQGPDPGP